MEHSQTIEQMESYLNSAQAALTNLAHSLDELQKIQPNIAALTAYHGSDEWFQARDLALNNALPKELRHGVLTEDLTYNLLSDHHELAIRMIEIAAEYFMVYYSLRRMLLVLCMTYLVWRLSHAVFL